MDFKLDEIAKVFNEGDFVKVIRGRNKGLIGVIFKLEDQFAHLVERGSKQEFKVHLSALQITNQLQQTAEQLFTKTKSISKYDFVRLNDGHTVGVVLQ